MNDRPYDREWWSQADARPADDLATALANMTDWLTESTGERVRLALQFERDRTDAELSSLRAELRETKVALLDLARKQNEINQTVRAILSPGLHSVAHDSPLREES